MAAHPSAAAPVVAVVWADGPPDDHLPTLASLRQAHPEAPVVVGGPRAAPLAGRAPEGVEVVPGVSLAALVDRAWQPSGRSVLVVCEPTIFAPGALGPALDVVDGQLSVASVSFLSNAAGPASFPYGHPVAHQPEGLDEAAVTARLRRRPPRLAPAPVAAALGPAALLSAAALSAVGDLVDDPALPAVAVVADWTLRARRRGFVNVLDPSTYCTRAFDGTAAGAPGGAPGVRAWLLERHPFLTAVEAEAASEETPLAQVHATARAKVLGVRVLVDGACLGPRQMGTQVQTVALVAALAANPEVESVAVALATGVPAYAATVLGLPKVTARVAAPGDAGAFAAVDVVHRPFQPDGPLDVDGWRRVGRRTVLTVLDLISYRGAAYHASSEAWLSYRRALRAAAARVDAVVTPTADVAAQVALERLAVEPERLVTAELGTDHLGGDEAATIPPLLLERGFAAGEFVLVMGANYAHKNRDLAVAALGVLRGQGRKLSLVAAGAAVPFGSSRAPEVATGDGTGVFVLPDLAAEERNWLLRHAAVVLYPTSAEGFGFVPAEAARFGTPTVFVPVGPLAEIYGRLPVQATDWRPASLAAAAGRLLDDPALAAAQVRAVLAAGAGYTWEAAAAKLVAVYRTALSLPPRTERPPDHG